MTRHYPSTTTIATSLICHNTDIVIDCHNTDIYKNRYENGYLCMEFFYIFISYLLVKKFKYSCYIHGFLGILINIYHIYIYIYIW